MNFKKNLWFGCAIIAATTFCACGGSSDEDSNDVTTKNVGVHKIDITMSGDVSKFEPTIYFVALDAQSNILPLHNENGTLINNVAWVKSYVDSPFTTTNAYSTSDCGNFSAEILLNNTLGKSGTITISAIGTFNGKQTSKQSKTITFSPDSVGKALYFESIDGFVYENNIGAKFRNKLWKEIQ